MQELVRQLGDYRLACFQAQEAFIDLYQGEHVRTGAAFSLAVFHTRVEGDAAARFEREAQRLVRLNHPNLIRIHDFNRAGNLAFLVQDVPSQSLRQLYPPGAQLPAPLVATYVRQIGEALQYAHEQGMVHGELRPEHLLLQPDRRSLLVSNLGVAGIAQAIASSGARRPARSPYLAPEQAWGPAQPASDQYALAALVYEWLSGEPLALSVGAANAATLHPLRSLAQKAPTLPAQAIQILQTALSQEPAQRFGSVQAFVNAFEQACATHREPPLAPQNQPILVPTPMGSTPPAGAPPILVPTPMGGNPPAPSPMPSLAQAPVDLRRRGLLIGLIAGGAGLALAGTGAAFFIKARLDASTQQPTLAYTHEAESLAITPLWSPDGSHLALLLENEDSVAVEVWETANQGNLIRWSIAETELSGERGIGWDIGWMQNTLRFAWISQDENSITIRDIMGQQQTVVTPGYKRQDGTNQPVDWLNWSADGTSLVLGTNESGLHIWNVLQKQDICVFPNPLLYLSWSPDRQRILSWDTDGIMDVWNAHTGSTLARYTKHHDEHPPVTGNTLISVNIQVAEWSPNGRWIASQGTGYQDGRPQDNIVHIWDANTGGELCTYSGHQDQGLSTLVWSPDSTMIASVGKDGLVHVWDARNGTRLFLHSDQNKGLTWAPSGARVASAGVLNDSSNVVFEVWDATTGKNVVSYTDPKIFDQADQIIWSPDGQHIVTVTYQEVQVWTGGR